jgi:hypothetical protein
VSIPAQWARTWILYYNQPLKLFFPYSSCLHPFIQSSKALMLVDEIRNIFLSITAKDCVDYRLEMQDALEKNVPVTVHLQEDWASAAILVMTVCQQKLKDQDGYMGLFGYRYGWIPPVQPLSAKSITHLEWEWAKQHWTSREPPIFIFLPNPGSEAEQELKRWAKEVLEDEYPNCPSEQQTSLERQESFRQEVRDWANGRCINSYETAREIREKGISCIHHWNKSILKQACEVHRGEIRKRIPAAELGAIGRDRQVKALEEILVQLRKRQREVAAAFVIHGEENHGQWQFAHFLHGWKEWNKEDEILPLFQPDRPEDAAQLARWVCNQLGQEVALAEAMERLVAALAFRLSERNVVILVQSLGNGPDRWQRFSEDFWSPLRQRLGQAVSEKTRGRLHWFVVANEPCPLAPAALDWDSASLIPLPQLQTLCEQDVSVWLSHRNPRLNRDSIRLEQRAEISKAVTYKNGNPDGLPISVFARLESKGEWEFDHH